MLPANNDEIVLSDKCENSDTSAIKEHLKFNFIPSKISDIIITLKRNQPANVRFDSIPAFPSLKPLPLISF